MKGRYIGLAIAVGGTIAVTPDAALLRLMDSFGGATSVITIWRFVLVGVFNFTFAAVKQGGIGPLCVGLHSAPGPLVGAALISAVTNIGFVVSLLKVDPAKALLLISLNPLWAALLGWSCLGDALEFHTIVAQILSLVSILLVFAPDVIAMLSHAKAHATGEEHEHLEPEGALDELYDLVPLVTGFAIAAFMIYSRYCSQRGISDASMEAAPPLSSLITACISMGIAHAQGVTSLTDGLSPLFWPTLALDSAGIAAYNVAMVLAPRYLPGAEVALISECRHRFQPSKPHAPKSEPPIREPPTHALSASHRVFAPPIRTF